jgi:hypothetical protein
MEARWREPCGDRVSCRVARNLMLSKLQCDDREPARLAWHLSLVLPPENQICRGSFV